MTILSLLHFDGDDGSTTFDDEAAFPWAVNGSAQLDTAQYKFSPSSGKFDGTGNWINFDDAPDAISFGGGDFTIDCWARPSNLAGAQNIFGGAGVAVYIENTGAFVALVDGISGGVRNEMSVSNNIWYHIALVRFGDKFDLYVDGVAGTQKTRAGSLPIPTTYFSIGRNSEIYSNFFFGWVDEFRIVKGKAIWRENFTPPSAPYALETFFIPKVTMMGGE